MSQNESSYLSVELNKNLKAIKELNNENPQNKDTDISIETD